MHLVPSPGAALILGAALQFVRCCVETRLTHLLITGAISGVFEFPPQVL